MTGWIPDPKKKSKAKGPKKGRKAILTPRIKYLHNYTSNELVAELMRRRWARTKKEAPELIAEREKLRKASRAIRIKYCDHSKLPPKIRKSGPGRGHLCCPSCHQIVELVKEPT